MAALAWGCDTRFQEGTKETDQMRPEPAEEQGKRGEQGPVVETQMPRFVQVGGQPSDVEIPAVGKTEVLEAQHPDLSRSNELPPGHAGMGRRQVLLLLDHPQLGRIDARLTSRIAAIPR